MEYLLFIRHYLFINVKYLLLRTLFIHMKDYLFKIHVATLHNGKETGLWQK